MFNRRSPPTAPKRAETPGSTIRFVIVWVVIIAVIRSLFFEAFHIPSGSMIPTILVGDAVIVTKYNYGFSRFSFPFSPNLFQGRIFFSMPHRGDIAVFRYTQNTSVDYIKRIIGLPGDHIRVTDGKLFLNGQEVPRQALGVYAAYDENRTLLRGTLYNETLPGSAGAPPIQHQILKLRDTGYANNTPEFVVPKGSFFAMGDDRDDSSDSRFQSLNGLDLGYVPMKNLVGKAQFIFFSIDLSHPWWQFWQWPMEVRWARLFHSLY